MLKRFFVPLLVAYMVSISSFAIAAEGTIVKLVTSKGNILLELNNKKAPITTDNFIQYVKEGYYQNTIFHRVIPGFMIQGGGFISGLQPQANIRSPIKNEADNGLRNLRGTIAMARTSAKDSATSQFFINIADNAFLDHGQRDFGYAVFGKVIKGMEVVDLISRETTTNIGPYKDVPTQEIKIISASVE